MPQIVDGQVALLPADDHRAGRALPACSWTKLGGLLAGSKGLLSLILDRQVRESARQQIRARTSRCRQPDRGCGDHPGRCPPPWSTAWSMSSGAPRPATGWTGPGGAGCMSWSCPTVTQRSDHLVQPPKHEEPFSTLRAWGMLSRALHAYGPGITLEEIKVLASGLRARRMPSSSRLSPAARTGARPVGDPEGRPRLAGEAGAADILAVQGVRGWRPADRGRRRTRRRRARGAATGQPVEGTDR